MARQISTDTGVGNADSDGPKSPSAMRFQNTVLVQKAACRPYSSRSDWRISAIASGLVLPKVVLAAMVCSTGSIGVACVMKNVMLTPMNTTSRNWPIRRSR